MAWFETGRTHTVEYQFTLTAHHVGGAGVCEGVAFGDGPNFTVRLASVRETVID